jgi:hypothetical protein
MSKTSAQAVTSALYILPQSLPTYRSTMPPPAQPPFRPGSIATPSLPPSVRSHSRWPPSPGFWVGVTFFIIAMVCYVVVYSYFASPYWFVRLKAFLGFSPSKRTPISRRPIIWGLGLDESEACEIGITRPQRAYLSSKETLLPVYEPAIRNFSNEVLVGILNLEVPPGARPPSYRSRLTWD